MTDDTTDQQLTPLQRRLIDAAEDIIETQADSPEFLHPVLYQVGLPRAETDARSFQRSSGTAAIEIAAGQLYRRGKFVPAPMPYGAKPRLVLMHLCAEAVRTRSPEIQVGRSIREFLGRLGLDNGGHEYARFRAQMEALAACRMTLGMQRAERKSRSTRSRSAAWRHGCSTIIEASAQREGAAKDPRATFHDADRRRGCVELADDGLPVPLIAMLQGGRWQRSADPGRCRARLRLPAKLAPGNEQGPVYLLGTGESVEAPMVGPSVILEKSGTPEPRGFQWLPCTRFRGGDERDTSSRGFRVGGAKALPGRRANRISTEHTYRLQLTTDQPCGCHNRMVLPPPSEPTAEGGSLLRELAIPDLNLIKQVEQVARLR